VFDFVRRFLQERPYLAKDDVNAYTLGEMDAALQATRTSMWYAAWLWEQGRYDEAELASMRALHTSKQAAMMITTKAFDVCGARSAFKSLPLERAFRDVRTFTLHFRESQVLRMLADADLGAPFHSKQKYGPKLPREALVSLRVPT
jgi:alkylation response protein AidB-like acyl-CoA dehydrogenase